MKIRLSTPVLLLTFSATVGCSPSEGEVSSSSTVSEVTQQSTTSVTTTLVPKVPEYVSESSLLNLLNDSSAFPPGWTTFGQSVFGFSTASETGGYCDGPNLIQRALTSGATQHAASFYSTSEFPRSFFQVNVFIFPTEDAAVSFVDDSLSAGKACAVYERSSTEDRIDGFLDCCEDATWRTFEYAAVGKGYSSAFESSDLVTLDMKHLSKYDSRSYTFLETYLTQYDRTDSVVFVKVADQRHSFSGYSDSDAGPDVAPITASVLRMLDGIVDSVYKGLLQ